MKKLLNIKKRKQQEGRPARITNETVAEHRERILAGGRRFKYPMQYARHRLVINAIVISVVALVAIVAVVWWQLYPQQNTSTFFYRITRVLPLPVASVDGQSVRYSDYLVGVRSQIHYLQSKEGLNVRSPESKSRIDFIKRQELDGAIADAYAAKLAKEKNVQVSAAQVDDALEAQRLSRDGMTSQDNYEAIVKDLFNWTPQEARGVTARKLLRQEVAYAVDKRATQQRDAVMVALQSEQDFEKVAAAVGGDADAKVTAGMVPLVPRNNRDGGRAAAAAKLEKGAISQPFKSTTGDGYYIVKLLESDNDARVSYAFIKIPLTEFARQLDEVKQAGKVHEYIRVEQVKTATRPQ